MSEEAGMGVPARHDGTWNCEVAMAMTGSSASGAVLKIEKTHFRGTLNVRLGESGVIRVWGALDGCRERVGIGSQATSLP